MLCSRLSLISSLAAAVIVADLRQISHDVVAAVAAAALFLCPLKGIIHGETYRSRKFWKTHVTKNTE